MKKTTFSTLLAAVLLLAAPAEARRSTGIGLAVAEPTAIDVKWWDTSPFAFNLGVGARHFTSHFVVYSDFEFRIGTVSLGSKATSRFYVGPGLMLGLPSGGHHHHFRKHHEGHVELDVSAPLGWEVDFRFPLNLFVEIKPHLGLVGHPARFDFGGQLGARYLF